MRNAREILDSLFRHDPMTGHLPHKAFSPHDRVHRDLEKKRAMRRVNEPERLSFRQRLSHKLGLPTRMGEGSAAPVEAPPRPDVKPEAPPTRRPQKPLPGSPSPWRRKDVKPGEEPRPKAYDLTTTCTEATELLRAKGFDV